MEQQLTGPVALFSSAWRLFRDNWKILVPLLILPSIASYIGQSMVLTRQPAAVLFGTLISLASVVFSIAMAPAFVNALHKLSTEPGTPVTINHQYRIGFGFFWSVILLGIMNGLIIFGSFFLLVIPAFVVAVYGSQYIFTLVIEGKKGFSALTESYGLVRNRWWPVFGRIAFLVLIILIAWLILVGLGFLLSLVFGVHIPVGTSPATALSFGALAISAILHLIGVAIIAPLALAYAYFMYISLKATRGTDVSTGAFKKWLVAFMCVGVLAILGTFVSVTAWGVASFIKAYKTVPSVSSTTPYTDSSGMVQGARPDGAGPTPN